jgi:RNA polymerase sigma-70 factor (sigma-E family)
VDERESSQFREYVQSRQAALFRSALLLTGSRQDAEDLLQEALTKLALRWHAIERAGSPDAYVRTTMYHQWISWWRRRGHGHEYATSEWPEMAGRGDLAADGALRVALVQILRQLTARQRAVVVLRFYEDLSESEVARILGCSVGTVRSQVHRTLARLRDLGPALAPTLAKEFDSA